MLRRFYNVMHARANTMAKRIIQTEWLFYTMEGIKEENIPFILLCILFILSKTDFNSACLIEQVEIGVDSPDFGVALRAAVRQAPDVIVLGEMRDPESMRIALTAAETGHLVFATVHTTDVASAVARITDGFPTERQNAIRQELAMALAAVLTQALMRSANGALIPAAELLMVSYGARQHIRKNALQHLNQEITITRKAGSFTLEESLAALVRAQKLDRQSALMKAAHPDELMTLLAG